MFLWLSKSSEPFLFCILISSKPTQGPRNPNQFRPGSSSNISLLHKPPFYTTNGYVCFEAHSKCRKTLFFFNFYYCSGSFDLLVYVARWPFATRGRGDDKRWAQRVCKLTCFTLPECWTGIEKEIVYIQMLATRCLLFLPSCFPITEET